MLPRTAGAWHSPRRAPVGDLLLMVAGGPIPAKDPREIRGYAGNLTGMSFAAVTDP